MSTCGNGAGAGKPARLEGLAAGARTLTAAALTLGYSYRRFDWSTGEDERHTAVTSDGWKLALYRYRARGRAHPYPVLCSHGMAGSRFIYDLHPDYSLARYLSGRGFDTWLVDLRGRGESWPEAGPDRALQWTFDDLAERDLPAAVARVCEITGAPQAFWVGMEMSGQALYAAAIQGKAGLVRGAVTCGSPVLTDSAALVPGVTAAPRMSVRGRVPFRSGARMAGPILAYGRSHALESSFRSCNTAPLVSARYFRNGIPDEAASLVDQFKTWIDEGTMRNLDGSVVYSDRLEEVKLPLLVMAAGSDLQRPAESVRAAYDAFGSTDKTFLHAGVSDGFSVDFGHDDLLAGYASPTEIFPLVNDWIANRSDS